jgi:NitT/TauT family transport system substrate-binding protein
MRTRSILLALAVLLAVGATLPASAADKVTVRLNWLARAYTIPHYLAAQDQGYFAEENLEVEIRPGKGSGDTVKLVAAGQDTFGQADAVSIIQARTQGVPVKAVMAVDAKNPFVIIASGKSGIKSVKDLAGKTSGVIPSSSPHWIYRALLKANDIDVSTIREVTVPPPGYAPLVQGAVDFISLWDTSTPVLEKMVGEDIVVLRGIDNGIDLYGTMVFVNDKTAEENPDLVKRFLRAAAKGMEYTRQNPDAVAKLVAAADPALKEAEERTILDYWMRYWTGSDHTIDHARMQKTQDLLVDQGIVPERVDISTTFTNEFAPR